MFDYQRLSLCLICMCFFRICNQVCVMRFCFLLRVSLKPTNSISFFCGYVTWRITLGKGNWFMMYRTNFSDVPHSSGITTFYTCKMRSFFAPCLRFNHPTGSTISRLFKPSPKKGIFCYYIWILNMND